MDLLIQYRYQRDSLQKLLKNWRTYKYTIQDLYNQTPLAHSYVMFVSLKILVFHKNKFQQVICLDLLYSLCRCTPWGRSIFDFFLEIQKAVPCDCMVAIGYRM
jgi:hypothetical protein